MRIRSGHDACHIRAWVGGTEYGSRCWRTERDLPWATATMLESQPLGPSHRRRWRLSLVARSKMKSR